MDWSMSIKVQQRRVYRYLPNEWKKIKKTTWQNVTWTKKRGFTEGNFHLPNRSEGWFYNYQMEADKIEGDEIHVAWLDELANLETIETIRYRLKETRGPLIITFCPKHGWTSVVASVCEDAKTLIEVEADMLPKPGVTIDLNEEKDTIIYRNKDGNEVPKAEVEFKNIARVQKPLAPHYAHILYFHPDDNPYGGAQQVKIDEVGNDEDQIMIRVYGYAKEKKRKIFPKFRKSIIIKADQVPPDIVYYHFADPHSSRREIGKNMFNKWYAIDPLERVFLIREWPCPNIYVPGEGWPGPWAVPSSKKRDGEPGEAQQSYGWGTLRYKKEWARLEGWTDYKEALIEDPGKVVKPVEEWDERNGADQLVYLRYMDSRFGNTGIFSKDKATTLIEEFYDIGVVFDPTPGDPIDEGIALINEMMDPQEDNLIPALRDGRFFIVDQCDNSIFSYKHWTGADGASGASKDPIDLDRYMAVQRIRYVDVKKIKIKKTTGYG